MLHTNPNWFILQDSKKKPYNITVLPNAKKLETMKTYQ